MRFHFAFSKMTNLLDLSECTKYFHLVYVEFLELICRFSLAYWEDPMHGESQVPDQVSKKVECILCKLWEHHTRVTNEKLRIMNSLKGRFKS
mmetsp:Transcript_34104/g.52387  ORF Transcript_34104/g.52387 Transcript_34104/m.52387 type:complete len:92 (-) Transcript_34104:114-389(-)